LGPDSGAWNTLLSEEVHKVNTPAVISINLVLFCFAFTNVPIALKATVPALNMVVGSAVGRAVKTGVGALGVLVGVGAPDVVLVGVNVGEGGAPSAITIDISEKPGGRPPPPPPPPLWDDP
jgi:hypothetical protein